MSKTLAPSTGAPVNIADLDKLIHAPSRTLIMANLYVVEEADFTFLIRQTGLTWGNLSSHMSKLEEAGYLSVEKKFAGRRPQTVLRLTDKGRDAFKNYRLRLQRMLDHLPD